jgi:GNAT superfamily N-acetyltransferase
MKLAGTVSEIPIEEAEAVRAVINGSNRDAYKSIIPSEYFREEVVSPDEMAEQFRKMTFYGYRHEEMLVGVAALEAEPDAVARMRWVYVHPQFQRMGVGTELVRHLENTARIAGFVRMRLLTAEKASWAISFYQKLGYCVTGRMARPWGADTEMQKELRSAN